VIAKPAAKRFRLAAFAGAVWFLGSHFLTHASWGMALVLGLVIFVVYLFAYLVYDRPHR
jgi:hypothetical protein